MSGLNTDNSINESQLQEVIKASNGLDITFHRAFDETNTFDSIKLLSKYKEINTILTSGGKDIILNNCNTLASLVELSKNQNILLGGGLNLNNLEEIKNKTNATDYHFGTAVREENSPFGKINGKKIKAILDIINTIQD